MTAKALRLRHLTSINDLSIEEIETIFTAADRYLTDLGDPAVDHRLATSTDTASGCILASLFYEPSTRTRLSFESAMLRLGGKSIGSADPATSSAAKGESLADTVRVASNYADVLVLRHPRDGAAKLAAEYASVPVINGGDGAHEHPTQTLCDLFTLKRENKTLKNLNVAISGDLKGSRTIHSFVYALARFGANLMMMPAKGMGLPEHVDWRLRNEFSSQPLPKEKYQRGNPAVDALYMTADKPHQLALIAGEAQIKLKKSVDAIYVTRFQKERWADKDQDYPRIDAGFLKGKKYSHTALLHPLPRVGELDISLDSDPRAAYFRQAAFGVPIRMALIALLLGVEKKKALERFPNGFRALPHAIYDQPHDFGIRCANPNCIVHDTMERQYTRNKFHIIEQPARRLRCYYCESDIHEFVAASAKTKTQIDALGKRDKDTVYFADAPQAVKAGYAAPKRAKKRA